LRDGSSLINQDFYIVTVHKQYIANRGNNGKIWVRIFGKILRDHGKIFQDCR
jgi:hypothetical protein